MGTDADPVRRRRGAAAPRVRAVDTEDLEAALDRDSPESLERAATLYRGDLLEGFALYEAPFDDWLQSRIRAPAPAHAPGLDRAPRPAGRGRGGGGCAPARGATPGAGPRRGGGPPVPDSPGHRARCAGRRRAPLRALPPRPGGAPGRAALSRDPGPAAARYAPGPAVEPDAGTLPLVAVLPFADRSPGGDPRPPGPGVRGRCHSRPGPLPLPAGHGRPVLLRPGRRPRRPP